MLAHVIRHARQVAPVLALLVAVLAAAAVATRHQGPPRQVLGSYTTDLRPRNAQQRHNIALAAAALADVPIRPGEELSFNAVVGPRTPERGYQAADAITMGGLEPVDGGGICQVSSTVYNAALLAGLRLTQRTPHTQRVSSVPTGRDATVDYGRVDLRFVNVFDEAVFLRCWVEGDRLHAAISGAVPAPRVTVEVARKPIGPPGERPGEVRAERATVRRTTRWPDGKEQTELVSDDVYAAPAF